MGNEEGYSGKFLVRIPPFLHEKLVRAADEQGVSLNSLVQACLAEAVARLAAQKQLRKLERRRRDEDRA